MNLMFCVYEKKAILFEVGGIFYLTCFDVVNAIGVEQNCNTQIKPFNTM